MTLGKKAFFLTFFLISNWFMPAGNSKIVFKLPVRIDKNHINPAQNFIKEDFKLFINNESRPISQLTRIQKSLVNPSGIGRNFLLSFHIINYNQSIDDGISYFLSEIINSNDMLVVVSPLGVYQIKISSNKEGISRKIKEIIGKDCKKFRKIKIQAEKKILGHIQRIHWSFTYGIANSSQFVSAANHLKYIEKGFNQYKKKFINPDLSKLQSLRNLFGGRDGNSWFIHLQQRKIYSFIPLMKRHLENLKRYYYLPLFKAVMKFKNESLYIDLFPFEQMKNLIIKKNFCFNLIFQDLSETFNSTLSQSLKKMTESTGGMFFTSGSIQQGFEKVKNHKDQYLELIYPFDGRVEDKTINLLLAGKEEGLAYPRSYNKNDVTILMNSSIRKRIGIQNIFIDKNRISFAVNSYKINVKKKFAILKIKIEAYNEHNICLFKTQNTLRASKETTIISVPLPRLKSKKIRLSIKAFDILANNFTSVEHNITQKQFPYVINK